MSESIVDIRDLSARFGDQQVLHGVNASVPAGQITVVLGASGSGKTTLLKHVLGLHRPTTGSVRLFDQELASISERELNEVRTRIGMLFQEGALLNSITVHRNARVPLEQHTDLPSPIIDRIVETKLDLLGIRHAADSFPDELSGGMRKRAGLARALALDPELLICDEPTSGLDPLTSQSLDELLVSLRDMFRMTMLIISHDIASVRRTADRLLFLHEGRFIFTGSIEEAERSQQEEVLRYFESVV